MVKAVSDSLKQKSVPKVSQSITYGKSDYRYWKAKVFKNSFMVNGEKYQQDEYSVKFQFKGRRERFNLYNANKELAAKKACEIFSLLIQQGWDSVIEKYKSSSSGKIELCRFCSTMLILISAYSFMFVNAVLIVDSKCC